VTCLSNGNNVDYLWHNRLGHVPFVKMNCISTIPITFSPKRPFMCPMVRQTRLPFPATTTVSSTNTFDLLHMDLWGPYHASTHNYYKYFLTIVDDFCISTWTPLLSCKSNTLQTIKSFISLVENQFKITVKSIRTDNGTEFTNNETFMYFQAKGIIHQKTCPYTPQ